MKGAGHPELEVNYAWDAGKRLACFSVKQTHKWRARLPLPPAVVVALVEQGSRREVEVEVTEQQHTSTLSCEREPSQAIFDRARRSWPRSEREAGADVDRELARGLAIDRVHAARELATAAGSRATQALIQALGHDESWACARRRPMRWASCAARRRATPSSPRWRHAIAARRRSVRALGSSAATTWWGHPGAVCGARDQSYFVEAEACLALGAAAGRAQASSCAAAARESFSDVIRQHATAGWPRRATRARSSSWGRQRVRPGLAGAAGALAAWRSRARAGDRAERDARERIEELLRARDFRVQTSALEAVGFSRSGSTPPCGSGRARAPTAACRRAGRARSARHRRGGARPPPPRSDARRVEKLRGETARPARHSSGNDATGEKTRCPGPERRAGRRRAESVRDTI